LGEAGIATPRADAELLATHVLGIGRGELLARSLRGDTVDDEAARRVAALVDRRCERVPLQHLTGRAPFRGLDLVVGPGVFVPRPETEVVAGLAVAEAARVAEAGREPLVVDLCAGSGAIALAVAHEVTAARVLALELDPGALVWARRNIEQSGLGDRVQLRAGDVRGCATTVVVDWAGQVDVVVANPPYIPPDALPRDPEVRDHDPVLALYGGGADGLAVPAAVVEAAGLLLRPGGLLVMEHAESQAGQARALAATPLWRQVHTAPDLTRRPRALLARRAHPV
jgi:release factor glutamine methyltransferase